MFTDSDSSLPSKIIKKMDNSLYSVKFSTENILQIINKLDFNNAYGHDEISFRMLKICGSSSVDLYKLFASLT